MRWLKTLWRWLLGLFRGKRPPPQPALRAERADDIPDQVAPGTVYVVGEGEHHWAAVMLCPCGCGETIQLNLLPDARPRWRVTLHEDGTATLWPSVWRVRGCGSHFFVRRGWVDWCRGGADTPGRP
jgi:hypothetical protein